MARADTVVVGGLVSLVARQDAVPYGRHKNLLLITRPKEHFLSVTSNAKMRSEKVFDFGGFLAQWETFLDRVFAFDATERKCSLGRVTSSKFL